MGKVSQQELSETVEVMTQLNAAAAEVATAVGAHAATDITGFGLVGHAHELADASGVTIAINASAVPLIGPTLSLAEAGMVTRTWRSTLDCMGDKFANEGVEETLVRVLADAQTSGGLLLSVPADRADDAIARLHAAGVSTAADIGEALNRTTASIVLRA
jgi:selenide,water dikinase